MVNGGRSRPLTLLALLPGGGGSATTSGGGEPPKDEKGLKEWIRN